ncbi:hypothetical protein [Streptosporangium sp. NPDC087985]
MEMAADLVRRTPQLEAVMLRQMEGQVAQAGRDALNDIARHIT